MSRRVYKSGAEKRKQKAEKDQSELDLLAKIPKIATLFSKEQKKNEAPQDDSTEKSEHFEIDSEITNSLDSSLIEPSSATLKESRALDFDEPSISTAKESPASTLEQPSTSSAKELPASTLEQPSTSKEPSASTLEKGNDVHEIENVLDFDASEFCECESLATHEIDPNVFSNDPGLWKVEINQSILQKYWVKKGNITVEI